jgi:hypothetical protein
LGGALNCSKIWEPVILAIFDGASSPNLEPRTDDFKGKQKNKSSAMFTSGFNKPSIFRSVLKTVL